MENGKIYLSVCDLESRYGVGKSAIWAWVKHPTMRFPQPIRLSPGATRWRITDLEEWEAARAAAAE